MYYKDLQGKTGWFKSLLKYLRDILVSIFPVKKIPQSFVKMLFGDQIDFVFFVHARRSQDFFVSVPALTIIRKILGKKNFLKLMTFSPSIVVSSLRTSLNKTGIVLVSPLMPHVISGNRQLALREMKRALSFARKISKDKLVLGLGGWWPILTNRGKYLKKLDDNTLLTIGHTVTILSICMTVDKIAKIGGIPRKDLRLLIIGAGKIGLQVADILIKEGVQNVGFIDINDAKLKKIYSNYAGSVKNVEVFNSNDPVRSKRKILNKYHLGVCATSTYQEIIKEEDMPLNFIIIDDSRPEAISRNIKSEDKAVLEGGLMKIKGLVNDYDYGFGKDENFFGCFCETYMLSSDEKNILKPTIGDVDYENYLNYKKFCEGNYIFVGDFKSADKTFSDENIKKLIIKRKNYLKK